MGAAACRTKEFTLIFNLDSTGRLRLY